MVTVLTSGKTSRVCAQLSDEVVVRTVGFLVLERKTVTTGDGNNEKKKNNNNKKASNSAIAPNGRLR
jgi:hypothetical protein